MRGSFGGDLRARGGSHSRLKRALGGACGLALFASIATLTACGPSKAVQCSEVIALVNDATKRIEEAPTKPDADRAEKIANLRAMAAGMAKVADDLAKVPTDIPELKDFSARYQKLAREFARLGNEMADAAEQHDVEKHRLVEGSLREVADAEGALNASVNEFCKGS